MWVALKRVVGSFLASLAWLGLARLLALSSMPAHWTGVNEAVNPDNTLAADALDIASRALNLQVCVLFQTDIAGSPLVLSSYCPGWNNSIVLPVISSHSGVSILESWFLRLLLPMLLAMTTGVHNPPNSPL